MDLSQIVALSDLISASVGHLVELSNASSQPKLNGASKSTNAGILIPALQVVAAASQLISLVRPPEQSVMDAATGYHLSSSLRLVVESHVVEIIREKGTGPKRALHVKKIAAENHVNDYKLGRILRALATHHIFEEVAPNTFANNTLSATLDTGKSLADIAARPHEKYDGTSGLAALIALTADESMRNSTAMTETLLDPASSASFAPLAAPFSRAWATEHTMFDWLSLPEHLPRLMRFGNAMNGISGLTPPDAVLRGFNWADLPPDSIVIDVGGGVGAAALPIVRSCPHIRLVIQDTEQVVVQAPKFWETHYPEALESGAVSFQVQDFFAPQPPASASAAVFLLRMIMHNWPDAESARILRRVRAAAGPRARLVLVDSILMHACPPDADAGAGAGADTGAAPPPLLPNWGAANALAYKLDLQMLCNHNAGERTLAEFTALLAASGWAVAEVHQFHQSWMPQIVAVPAPLPAGVEGEGVELNGAGESEERVVSNGDAELAVSDGDVDKIGIDGDHESAAGEAV